MTANLNLDVDCVSLRIAFIGSDFLSLVLMMGGEHGEWMNSDGVLLQIVIMTSLRPVFGCPGR